MHKLNSSNMSQAEKIIFGDEVKWERANDIKYIEELSIEQLKALEKEGLLDLEDSQNCSPTIKEFMEFMEEYPQVKAHGYIVSPKRDDCRISLEGLICNENITDELLFQFANGFHSADEFEISKEFLRVWWD